MFLFLLLVQALNAQEVPRPQCGGILSAIKQNNGDAKNCSWIDLAQPSGKVTREVAVDMCQDKGNFSTGNPQTVFSFDEHAYFFMTGSGQNLYWVDDATVEVKNWVQFPAQYGWTVGIQCLGDRGVYILTTTTLYNVPSQGVINAVLDVTSWKLDQTALLSSNFWDPFLHISQGSVIYTVNFTDASKPAVSMSQTTLTQITDLEVYLSYVDSVTSPTLLAMTNYELYLLDATTGLAKKLMDVPKGPGNPRINTLGPDTFFFCDNANIYSIDVPTGKLLTTSPFTLAPDLQGYFEYHP